MSRRALGKPEDRLGYLLKHASMRLEKLGDAALKEHGIDSRDFGILLAIADGDPRSQQDIAERLEIDRTTMVARLDSLESRGIVARRPDPSDRRRNVIELTELGERTLEAAHDAANIVEQRIFRDQDAQSVRGLHDALRIIAEQ